MVLLIAYRHDFTPEMFSALEGLGLSLRFLTGPETQYYDEDFSDVDAVICYRFFTYNDISRFPALKLIQLTSHGIDHLPLEEIRARGIRLYDARGAYGAPMAEFALGGVLQLYKAAPMFFRQQQAHVWAQNRGLLELSGKQVCIVGTGSVGTECATRFRAMGCRVTGVCRHPAAASAGFDCLCPLSALDEVLGGSDIVILTLPLNAESRHLFDAQRFRRMKSGAVLVNIARGAVVETQALADALADGRLLGAVADVFETEPLPADSPLWETENLIIAPHNSFAGEHNAQRLFDMLYPRIKIWFEENGGKTP